MSKLELSRPSGKVRKVTKSDTTDLPDGPCRALNCATEGTINYVDLTGHTLTDYAVHAGENAIQVRRVKTGGTVDDIWAMY